MARINLPLTAAEITKAVSLVTQGTAPRIELRDGATPGLRLRVGRRAAVWDMTVPTKSKRVVFTIGKYPQLQLKDARALARQKHEVAVKTGAGAAAAGADTLAELIEVYEKQRGRHQRAWDEAKRSIKRVFAPVLDTRLVKLERLKLQNLVDQYPSAAGAAHSVRAVRPMLKWAFRRDLLTFDPAQIEQPASPRKARDRFLDKEELARVWKALGVSPYDHAMRLLLWTACRKREVTDALWAEFDLKEGLWTIPKERMKSGRMFIVPLPAPALALLKELKRSSGSKRVFADTMTNWDRHQKQVFAASDTSGWHRHDLRRTAATVLGQLDFDPHIIEVVLGHKVIYSEIAGIYNQHRYLKQHREALEALSNYYASL